MINVFLIFTLLLLAALYDVAEILNKKQWRELSVFVILFVSVLTIAILQIIHINIPSPIKGIETLIQDILKIGYP